MADDDSRAGARYGTRDIHAYVDATHAGHDAVLTRAFAAPALHGMPAIQVGVSEGKLIGLLLSMAGATRVVEIGTLAGYSAIRIARALPPEGHVWTIEADPHHHAIASDNVQAAGLGHRITCLLGPALSLLDPLAQQHGPFDAVFIDADKGNYDRYGEWALANLRQRGLLIGDNAYLFGRLLADSDEARAMRRFHEQAALRMDSVCVPTPDGLLLAQKR
jgi:caffeoyl-CoA O-methyltransferase